VLGLSCLCIIAWCLFLYFEEPLGAHLDAYLRQRYHLYLLRQQQQKYIYPDVVVKATRKVEHNHYSYYLHELFRRRELSVVTEPTKPAIIEIQSRLIRTAKRCSTLVHWFCQRCLRSGFQGSYARCPSVCSTCSCKNDPMARNHLPTLLANPHHIVRLPQIGHTTIQIPRKIHQVGKALIRTLEYPELARLQSTWRSLTGYEYYFYTAKDQVAFLKEAYDPVVLQMYQSVATHREEQEHLFALLVLYRYGGIYADTNVQWQLPLDALVQRDDVNNMSPPSLILPRHPHLLQRHCLYNGWVAATPGHPVLAQLILQALMVYNGTSSLPTSASPVDQPIWKWYVAEPESYRYGGACAWGAAVNSHLRRDTTGDFDRLGHYHIPKRKGNATSIEGNNNEWGPVLVLMVRYGRRCDV
jgi:Glycosyltransferase sugar-binding region containing DXD motif